MLRARILSTILLAALAVPAWTAPLPLKPEDAYLSPNRYLSRYFGLSLTIPSQLNLVPLPIPEVQGKTRWLLALRTASGKHAVTVFVTASPPPKKGKVAAALLSDFSDSYPEPGKPKRVEIGGETFWKVPAPDKPEDHTPNILEYGGIVRDYLLTIRVSTDEGAVPDGFARMVESAVFVPPSQIAAEKTADMTEYAGPALPELGQPTTAIAKLPSGMTAGRVYRNDAIGIAYEIPQRLQPQPAIQETADNASRYLQAWGGNADPKIAHLIAITCTRPLLFADDGEHRNDGHIGAAVAITAVDPICLQGARFPASASDHTAMQLFVRALAAQIHVGRQGTSFNGRIYRVQGHIFVNLSGIVYGTEPGTGLKIPNPIRVIATQLNGYLVVWTFVAPDRNTLEQVANSTVRLYETKNQGAASPAGGATETRK